MNTTNPPEFAPSRKEPAPSGNAPGSAVPGATNPPPNPGSRGGGDGQPGRRLRPMAKSPRPNR
jgi:hypothetical protein